MTKSGEKPALRSQTTERLLAQTPVSLIQGARWRWEYKLICIKLNTAEGGGADTNTQRCYMCTLCLISLGALLLNIKCWCFFLPLMNNLSNKCVKMEIETNEKKITIKVVFLGGATSLCCFE